MQYQIFSEFMTDFRTDDVRGILTILDDLSGRMADLQERLNDFEIRLRGTVCETDAQYREMADLQNDVDEIYRCIFHG